MMGCCRGTQSPSLLRQILTLPPSYYRQQNMDHVAKLQRYRKTDNRYRDPETKIVMNIGRERERDYVIYSLLGRREQREQSLIVARTRRK